MASKAIEVDDIVLIESFSTGRSDNMDSSETAVRTSIFDSSELKQDKTSPPASPCHEGRETPMDSKRSEDEDMTMLPPPTCKVCFPIPPPPPMPQMSNVDGQRCGDWQRGRPPICGNFIPPPGPTFPPMFTTSGAIMPTATVMPYHLKATKPSKESQMTAMPGPLPPPPPIPMAAPEIPRMPNFPPSYGPGPPIPPPVFDPHIPSSSFPPRFKPRRAPKKKESRPPKLDESFSSRLCNTEPDQLKWINGSLVWESSGQRAHATSYSDVISTFSSDQPIPTDLLIPTIFNKKIYTTYHAAGPGDFALYEHFLRGAEPDVWYTAPTRAELVCIKALLDAGLFSEIPKYLKPATSAKGSVIPLNANIPHLWASAALTRPLDDGYISQCARHAHHSNPCSEHVAEILKDVPLIYTLVLSAYTDPSPGTSKKASSPQGPSPTQRIFKIVHYGTREAAASGAFYAAGTSGWDVVFSCVMRGDERAGLVEGKEIRRVAGLGVLVDDADGESMSGYGDGSVSSEGRGNVRVFH